MDKERNYYYYTGMTDTTEETAQTASGALPQTTLEDTQFIDQKGDNKIARGIGIAAAIVLPHMDAHPLGNVNDRALEALHSKDNSTIVGTNPANSKLEGVIFSPTPIIEQVPVPTFTPEAGAPAEITVDDVLSIAVHGQEGATINEIGLDVNQIQSIFDFLVENGFPKSTFNGQSLELLTGGPRGNFIFRQLVDVPKNGEPVGTENVPVNERGSVFAGEVNEKGELQLLFFGPGQIADQVNRNGGSINPREADFRTSVDGYLDLVNSTGQTAGMVDLGAAFKGQQFLVVFGLPIGSEPTSVDKDSSTITFGDGSVYKIEQAPNGQFLEATRTAESSQGLEATITPPNGVDIAIFVYDAATGKYNVDHKLSGINHKIEPIAVTPDGKLVFEENGIVYYVAAANTDLSSDEVSNLPIRDPKTGESVSLLDSYEYLSPESQVSVENRDGRDVLIIDGVEYPTTQLKIDGEDLQSGIHTKYGYVGGENVVYFVGFEKRGDYVSYTDVDGVQKSVQVEANLVGEIKWSDGKSYKISFPITAEGSLSLRGANGGATGASLTTLMRELSVGEELELWTIDWDVDAVNKWETGLAAIEMDETQRQESRAGTIPIIGASRAYLGSVVRNYSEYSSGRPPTLNSKGEVQSVSPTTIVHP